MIYYYFMKNDYLLWRSLVRLAHHAELPGEYGSLSRRSSSLFLILFKFNLYALLVSLNKNSGRFSLKILSQTPSKKIDSKNPEQYIAKASINADLAVKSTVGTKTQQIKNRIKRTLGIFRAYSKSSCLEIFHSVGITTSSLKACHNLSLFNINIKSMIKELSIKLSTKFPRNENPGIKSNLDIKAAKGYENINLGIRASILGSAISSGFCNKILKGSPLKNGMFWLRNTAHLLKSLQFTLGQAPTTFRLAQIMVYDNLRLRQNS